MSLALSASACADPPPKLVSTPKDARFVPSPNRNMNEAWVSLSLSASDSGKRGVVRGRPLVISLIAGQGGSRKNPLVLAADNLLLEVAGPDGGMQQWAPELLTERRLLDATIDKNNPFAEVEWFIAESTTRDMGPGTYRLRVRWGGGEASLELNVVEAIASIDDDRRSRRGAAIDRAKAARAHGQWLEMQHAVDAMLTELPNDPALLRIKAEALELSGDLEGAWGTIRRAVAATQPPDGVEAPEVPDPLSQEARSRIGKALMLQRQADGGMP